MARSKRYQAVATKLERGKVYPLSHAIKIAKESSYASFDGSIDLHITLVGKKPEEKQFRSTVSVPRGIGKKQKVEILSEETIEAIAKSGQAPADLYLATAALMPKVAKIAKILGPKGKMPSPKSGTVTDKPEEKVKELTAGNLIELRSDPTGILHISIGRVSWGEEQLLANAEAILKVVPRSRVGSISLAATMGPSVRVGS